MTPERSIEQRTTALEHANRVRAHRATIKKDLKAGRVKWTDVLTSSDPLLNTMKVFDVLLAVRGVGRTKVLTVLKHCDISPAKTVGGITRGQRDKLLVAQVDPLSRTGNRAELRRIEWRRPSLRTQLAQAQAELEALRMERAA